ncbi:MAG: PDZ domain-containing protein [Acidimicrobiia bacterium]|nr:PDZ domain-containing protein [Acidimicrobiia bacterium]
MAGRAFDAQVVLSPPDSPRGKLLSQYVCARLTRMDDIDAGLLDRDWNNTLYYFIMNAEEHIYLRYGGRDSRSPDSYLNLSSLELALEKGLELHRQFQRGELKASVRAKPLFPRDIPLLVERTLARNACVECHLIGDYLNVQREQEAKLDKRAHMYRSPDIRGLGIELDVPKGLLVKSAREAAAAAGIQPGDRIAAIEGTTVWTFGDFQHRYDTVDRNAKEINLIVERNGKRLPVSLALPKRWWWTDLTFRQWTIEPRVYFESVPLAEEEKRALGLSVSGGFSSRVKHVDMFAEMTQSHSLRVGDIVFAVDGVESDEEAHTAELFIKLRKSAGQTLMLEVIRDGKRMKTQLKTYRMSFRK